MAIKLVQSYVEAKVGMSEIAGWELSKRVSIETKAATSALDLSLRKILPSHIIIEDGVQSGTVTLGDAEKHDGKAIIVINNDADEAVSVGGVSCAFGEKTVVYSDGSSWAKLYSIALS